ncbi:MAG: hypothetical protein ABEJ07_02760 [Candidatus Nanohaloarchaea archaeon]
MQTEDILATLDDCVDAISTEFYESDGYLHVSVRTDYDALEDVNKASLELESYVMSVLNGGERYRLAFRRD